MSPDLLCQPPERPGPILTRGERLQIVQGEIDAHRASTMPGPSLAVRIVDALRDAYAERGFGS